MRKYRVGILGSGVISRTYAADIQAFYSRKLDLAACADIDAVRAEKLAEEFGIRKAYTTDELLADPEIDIVINLTPPGMHVELNSRIIRSGKHLFSEKPFAETVEEAEQVLKLAEEYGVRIGSAPDTFLGSGIQSLRYYLDAGLIGKPFFATANMVRAGHETWHPNPVHFYGKGSGPVYDMGPYYISALIVLLGPLESIASLSASPSPVRHIYRGANAGENFEAGIPTHYTCILKFKSGAVANLNISFDVGKSNLPMLEIYGDRGTLSYPDPNYGGGTPKIFRFEQCLSPIYQDTPEAHDREDRMYELPELFIRQKDYSRGIGVLDLAEAIENGTENRANGKLVLHVTEALQAIVSCADSEHFYKMRTTCERPEPLKPGSAADQV